MTTQTNSLISDNRNLILLFSQVPEMFCLMSGPKHLFEFVNEAHKKVLGFDATGKTVREAQPESTLAHELLDKVYNTGVTEHLKEVGIVVGKYLRYFNLTYAPRFGDTGKVSGIMILGVEITEQVQRARGLALQQKALEASLNGSPIKEVLTILVQMLEQQIGHTSKASILLASADERRLFIGAASSLPDAYNRAIDGIVAGPDMGSCGTAAFRKEMVIVSDIQNDPLWAKYKVLAEAYQFRACWSQPILSTHHKLLGTFALYSSEVRVPTRTEIQTVEIAAQTAALILERQSEYDKRLEGIEALKESDYRLNLALVSANIGLWDWNAKTGYVYLSDTLMKEWDIDPSQFKNTLSECLELIVESDREMVWKEIKRSTFESRPYDIDYRVNKKDGSQLWINAKGRYYIDKNGDPERLTGVTINITERRKAAKELEVARDDAERANHLKSAFLANMSHEIRTPLGAMMGFAELLGDPSATSAEKANYIDILQKNGEQLSHVINDILDLSKVETGHINFEYMFVRPLQVAHEVVSLMSVLAREKGLALSFHDDGTTPEEIVTDPTRMKQVLMNLVGNALKFTKVGSIRINLSGYEGAKGEKCCGFTVTDTGVGIPEASVDKLFKMFSQADNSMTRKFGGTGLGLALSRSLARAMGGDVELIKTQANLGSIFKFSVESREELASEAENTRTISGKVQLAELPADYLNGVRILLIEDSADNQQLIWYYLSKYGAQVEIADNGSEGMTKALATEHDIVLCDLQMPVMDGYTAIGKLRSRGYRTPIIALTAHAMADVRKKCHDVGCDDHLPKPINSRELIETIKKHITQSREPS